MTDDWRLDSIEEIAAYLRKQARMRAEENDEAGVLLRLAAELERDVAELEQGPCPFCEYVNGSMKNFAKDDGDFYTKMREGLDAGIFEKVGDDGLACKRCGHSGGLPGWSAECQF